MEMIKVLKFTSTVYSKNSPNLQIMRSFLTILPVACPGPGAGMTVILIEMLLISGYYILASRLYEHMLAHRT